MTSASPTAASAAAIAMEKIATITPVGCAGSGLKRQKATKFMFAAASISSIPIRMKMAWRRLSAASKPMENKAADKTRKMVSVGVMRGERTRLACWFRRPAETSFVPVSGAGRSSQVRGRACQHASRVRSPDEELRVVRSSPFFLRDENQRADERGGEQEPDAL